MGVANLHKEQKRDHAVRIGKFALDAIQAANATWIDEEDPSLGCINIRVGYVSALCVMLISGT